MRHLPLLLLLIAGCSENASSPEILFREDFDDEEGSAMLDGVNAGWMLLIDQGVGQPPASAYFTAVMRETAGVMPGAILSPPVRFEKRLVMTVELRPEGIGLDTDPVFAGLRRGASDNFGVQIVAGSSSAISFVTPSGASAPEPLSSDDFHELRVVVTENGHVSIQLEGDERVTVDLGALAPEEEWWFAMNDAEPTGAVWTDNIVLSR